MNHIIMKTTKIFIAKLDTLYHTALFQTFDWREFKDSQTKELDRLEYNAISKVYLELLSDLLKLYDSRIMTDLYGTMCWELVINSKSLIDIYGFVSIVNEKQIIIDNTLLEIIIDDNDFTTRDRL